ncbi:hypothetical protein J2Z48_003043 [Croceifilum oryzae]|uniref:DUF3969 family protein n=1 Tax=Croceifilum oryzae TaxID=1553429 RepID=A0AAJ1WTW0_9BACL|nr:DUF3969 family protein [Croceifilum oryzae]MDQ0418838.1 hypothetical protein [Croceifilum oryzae]
MLRLEVSKKNEIERVLSIILLGMLSALEKGLISIEEAEGYLFSPYSFMALREMGISEEIISIVEEGCELEDVESLRPEKLLEAIIELRIKAEESIRSIPTPSIPTEKIIVK